MSIWDDYTRPEILLMLCGFMPILMGYLPSDGRRSKISGLRHDSLDSCQQACLFASLPLPQQLERKVRHDAAECFDQFELFWVVE